jgi:hypothetical protein
MAAGKGYRKGEPERPAKPPPRGGPRWRSLRRGPLQSEKLRIDPLADWYFSDDKRANQRAAVLVGLRAGIRPRDLLKPPKGLDVGAKDWSSNLSIAPAYVSGPAASLLEQAGIFTGFATRRFFDWLVRSPALHALVESITLSAMPPEPKAGRPALRAAAKGAGAPAAGGLDGADVVLALIDDWVGVANKRFRHASGGTRCLSLWLQGVEGVGAPPPSHQYGRELKRAEIDVLLAAAGADEEKFERSLFASGEALPGNRISHGTHVADLFAGSGHDTAAEIQEGKARPIICVALPRSALPDTSGLSIVNEVCDAVAHVIETVTVLGGANPPPIVLNYSNGAMSDVCHHLGALRNAITGMMDAYNQAHPQAPLTIVTAAGNSFQEQGHACLPRRDVSNAERWPLDMRVLPDDRSPSFVRFELPPGASAYNLSVTPPGLPTGFVDGAATFASLEDNAGRQIAFLQYDPPALPHMPSGIFTLIIEPTADPLVGAPGALAPHGVWKLELGGPDRQNGKSVHVFIARDVTLPGFPSFGRQSRFEDARFQKRDAMGRLATVDTKDSAIKRGGAINVLGTDLVSGPVSIAARIARTNRPADYSSAGYPLDAAPPGDIRGPDAIADAEHSEVVTGVLATGLRTGSVVSMNGTSVASPIAARAIANALAAGAPGLPADANAGRVLARRLALAAMPPPPPPDARSGHGLIPMSGRRNLALATRRDR